MLRFFYYLFSKEFEPCKGCEILKQQLEAANFEKTQLMNTMLGLVKPEVIQQPVVPVKPFIKTGASWQFQKRMLEEKDREEFRIRQEMRKQQVNPEVEKLEKELGIENAGENQESKTV